MIIKLGHGVLSIFLVSLTNPSMALDAFGLDKYKKPAYEISNISKDTQTRLGNTLKVYSIKSPLAQEKKSTPRFFIQGGLHGNELLTSEFVAWAAVRVSKGEGPLSRINLGNVEFDFLPYANPDGTVLYARYNGNKINLNRNFGVLWGITKENPGTRPFSEVESRLIKGLISSRSYSGAIDVHGFVNWIVLPTSPSDPLRGIPDLNGSKIAKYKAWNGAIASEMKDLLPGYELKTAGGLGDGGAFEDYAWWEAGVPSFCLEMFTNQRIISNSIANQVIDLIMPKNLNMSNYEPGKGDSFLVYEKFIAQMFEHALKLNSQNSQMAQTK